MIAEFQIQGRKESVLEKNVRLAMELVCAQLAKVLRMLGRVTCVRDLEKESGQNLEAKKDGYKLRARGVTVPDTLVASAMRASAIAAEVPAPPNSHRIRSGLF